MRDPDAWYDSVHSVVLRLYWCVLLPFAWVTRLGRRYTAVIRWNLRTMFGSDISREACIGAFEAHHAWVRERVPPKRLLVWRPQDGWEPLCRRADSCMSLRKSQSLTPSPAPLRVLLLPDASIKRTASRLESSVFCRQAVDSAAGFWRWMSPHSPSRRRRTRVRARCCCSWRASGGGTRSPPWACGSATAATGNWTCGRCDAGP